MAWWKALVAAVPLVAILFWTAKTAGDWQFEQKIAWARREISSGRFTDAHHWLAGLTGQRATRADALDLLAVCEHQAGHFEMAIAAWSRIPKNSPQFGAASLARAQTLVGNLGRFSEAETVLEQALLAHDPAELELRHALSQLDFWQFRPEAMRRVIRDGRRRWIDPAAELRDLWQIDDATVMLADVRAAIESAERLAPSDDRVWLARAGLEMAEGDLGAAGAWLDRCLQQRPEDANVWLARMKRSKIAKDRNGVLVSMSHLPDASLLDYEILDLAAWLAREQNDAKLERTILERRIRTSPVELSVYDRLAVLDLEAGLKTESAALRRKKGELDAAKDRYRRRLLDRAPVSRFDELGALAEVLDRPFEAEGWWTLAYRERPGDPSALAALERLSAQSTRSAPTPSPVSLSIAQRIAASFPDLARPSVAMRGNYIAPQTDRPIQPPAVRFDDRAAASGLNFVLDNGRSRDRQLPETTCGGVALLDYNGDGWLDVYVIQGGRFPPDPAHPSTGDRLFRNRGNGQFEDVTSPSRIAGLSAGYGHGVTVADYDNDGRPDLFLTRWGRYQLLHNRGDGTFDDATERAGLAGDHNNWPTSAAFADLDNDGDLDLYVCHYLIWDPAHPTLCDRSSKGSQNTASDAPYDYCMPNPFPAEPDHLFRNDGGRFVDVTAEAGIIDANGRGLGVVAADVDDDGFVDLFVANDTSANYLWHNLGNMKFEESGIASGVACNAAGAFQAGMGTAVGDLDGDGKPDLFVTNFYGESTTYFQNMGHSLFADRTASSGLAGPSRYLLGFGIVLFDANNDGYLDLSTTNGHVVDQRPSTPLEMPALLMLGGPGGRLTDASEVAGSPFQMKCIGRALAAGDIDNDGRIDLIAVPQNSPLVYFHNQSKTSHGVSFLLEGTKSNRDGVGAVVTVTAGGRERRAWRSGGGSFQSASDPRIHFGLGEAKIEQVEVRWPSGVIDRFAALEWDQVYRAREGNGAPVPMRHFAAR